MSNNDGKRSKENISILSLQVHKSSAWTFWLKKKIKYMEEIIESSRRQSVDRKRHYTYYSYWNEQKKNSAVFFSEMTRENLTKKFLWNLGIMCATQVAVTSYSKAVTTTFERRYGLSSSFSSQISLGSGSLYRINFKLQTCTTYRKIKFS